MSRAKLRLSGGRQVTLPARFLADRWSDRAEPQSQARADAGPTAAPTRPAPAVSEEQVRLRAYLKWEGAGRPPGDGVNFWVEAEGELRGGR